MQGVVVNDGQVPVPLQNAWFVAVGGFVAVLPLQLGDRQLVSAPGRVQVALVPLQNPRQAPVPEQARFKPRGAGLTKPQVPGEPPLQNSHAPLQRVLQQTVSTQLPLTHWPAVVHDCPVLSLQMPVASQPFVPVQLSASSPFRMLTQVPPLPVQA